MATTKGTTSYSGVDAMIATLRAADGPLTAIEIATAVVDSGVCTSLNGKTPKATLGAKLYMGDKDGAYFKRVGKGRPARFALRADAPDSDPPLVATLKKQLRQTVAASKTPAKAKATPAKAKTTPVKKGAVPRRKKVAA